MTLVSGVLEAPQPKDVKVELHEGHRVALECQTVPLAQDPGIADVQVQDEGGLVKVGQHFALVIATHVACILDDRWTRHKSLLHFLVIPFHFTHRLQADFGGQDRHRHAVVLPSSNKDAISKEDVVQCAHGDTNFTLNSLTDYMGGDPTLFSLALPTYWHLKYSANPTGEVAVSIHSGILWVLQGLDQGNYKLCSD